MKYKICGFVCWLYAVTSFAGLPSPSIIPLPEQMQVNAGTFTLCPTTSALGVPAHATTQILVDSNSLATGEYLASLLFRSTGYEFQIATNNGSNAVKGAILLTTVGANTSLGAEGYELTVAPDSVVSRAPAEAGVFYGVQSLLQLLPPQILSVRPVTGVAWVAPCVYIKDQPRFSWRGYMMDESRHFFGKQEVKKFMDAMALQKMNTIHWHLVDDEGWRIQILAYPLLTQTSGWRNGWTNSQNNGVDFGQNPRASTATNGIGQYGGFYTQDEIREIVAYAQQRHITIVPEIEMPAHCTSGLYAYPRYGCGNPQSAYIMDVNSTENINYHVSLFSLGTNTASTNAGVPFLENILTEVAGLFPGPYIHCGGDEVIATGDTQWTNFPTDSNQLAALGITGTAHNEIIAYQHWFSTNIAAFLKSKGKTMMGWSEFEAGGTVNNAVLEDWETGSSSYAVATAEAGQPVVMAPNAYTYLNYYMSSNNLGSGEYPPFEPYFNSHTYLTLSNVYGFEPVPTNLPAQYTSNILGAECAEWAEYIPSTLNEEFKAFPRLCALAEVEWTQPMQKNYTNFTQRLVAHEQRLTAMGMNYDATNGIVIGTWGPSVPTNTSPPTSAMYDITPYVQSAGDINLDFHYTSGSKAINVYSASLLVNGAQVDVDTNYIGYSGLSAANLPYFILHLKTFQPGATYSIQTYYAGYGGTNSNGKVYMVNWN
ncbi:MAG TPA: beta-N-acetylhexosaminidase [Verrucomicrobiae bacterium]|nr:beta-N-acetylhexosaminidase [Verrucomicrobiae bacterium]